MKTIMTHLEAGFDCKQNCKEMLHMLRRSIKKRIVTVPEGRWKVGGGASLLADFKVYAVTNIF